MKKYWFTALCLLIGILYLPSSLVAQRERPVTKTFKEKIWYGGSFGLGFSGANNNAYFNFGIFPMAGYSIIPWFSIGPRIGVDYVYLKTPSISGPVSTNVFGLYGGLFARGKVLSNFFLHAEYGVDGGSYPYLDSFGNLVVENGKVVKARISQERGLIGVGYNSGGLLASEIMILYDVLLPSNSYQNPFEFRVGFTYKF